jgi:ribosomal protein S18 acetylase RimI-like enzyme
VRADRRGQHIGSALILAAEQLLIERRRDLVALGVAPNNYQAYRLYRRLRYQPWGYPDVETFSETFLEDGTRVRAKETCRVLVKRLPVADIGAVSD